MPMKIKFGTEGWRGIIADDFNFENLAKVTGAISGVLPQGKNILVGYDSRFLSERFAQFVASIFRKNGHTVKMTGSSVITPNLCYATKTLSCEIGIMITASHNPYQFNGIKIKAPYGGPVPVWFSQKVEENLGKQDTSVGDLSVLDETGLTCIDIVPDYIEYLGKSVDLSCVQKIRKKIVFDCMYGPSGQYIRGLFNNGNTMTIRAHRDPTFGGMVPEPVEKNLSQLKKAVIKEKAGCGLAFDGDGDRLGVIDDTGSYLPPHIVFPLLLDYLVKVKELSGSVVQTISLGYLSRRIAKRYNLPFTETRVGFKYIADKLLNENVLLGGEESGGYWAMSEIEDRDGVLSALILIEMLGSSGKKLSRHVFELQEEFGKSFFLRDDIRLKEIIFDKDNFSRKVTGLIPKKIFAKMVSNVDTWDGIRIALNDDSWLLMRPSGTEPVLRVYAETDSPVRTRKLISFGKKLAGYALKNTK
ncbi:MAG: phosphoglucomutase/phosphomannomutase family protein [Elusimicrobiota bacterium]